MLYLAFGLLVLFLGVGLILFEFRFRYPDEVILSEGPTSIRIRRNAWYPRHFSLALKRTTSPLRLTIEATAAGHVDLHVKLVGAVAPSMAHLEALIRAGGWNTDAVARAAQELQIFLQSLVRELTEVEEIGSISSQKILERLDLRVGVARERFGLDVISLGVHSLEPIDRQIFDALKRQEQARILEQTELLNQQARVKTTQTKLKADLEILIAESAIAVKKSELEKIQMEKEGAVSNQRLEDELRRSRQRLQFEKEELEVLKSSPELLMLTPQAARLAEASQKLKNAHTVISLSPQDHTQGAELLGLLQGFLEKALHRSSERSG